jgi:hypothetical protein
VRPQEQLVGSSPPGVIGDLIGRSHHEHAPTLVTQRIARGGLETGRPGGLEDGVAVEHGVVHRETSRDRSDRLRQPTHPAISEQREARGSLDRIHGTASLVALRVTDPAWRHEGAVVEADVPKPDADRIGTSSRSMVV